MSTLAKYRQMRDFERTQEPRGRAEHGKKLEQNRLSFVVQKHAARNLHYDFRLELDGVLLSWAVPKGPSRDPGTKRLAVEVEPHPIEYGDFEGIIPKGEYGGGTVMVWDRGTWAPEGDPRQALAKGHLAFSLYGQKLKGAWHLVRTRRTANADTDDGKSGKGWLLFKSHDAEAHADDNVLDDEPDSALTGRTLSQISGTKEKAETKTKARAPKTPKRVSAANASKRATAAEISKPAAREKAAKRATAAKKTALPNFVAPELATLVDAAPTGEDWLHEIKLDGYRIVARADHDDVKLFTRNSKDWTARLPSLHDALAHLKIDGALLDGELVALNSAGVSDFQTLQNSLNSNGDAELVYYAFDLLHLGGKDLTDLPLIERKARLSELLSAHESALAGKVRFSAHVVGNGTEFFDQACKLGLEGTIAKRTTSRYRSGRGRDWLKIKGSRRQEFSIIGYSAPGGSRSHFGALLLGTQRDGKLGYAGKVGTGFSEASLAELHRKLQPLVAKTPPVDDPPRGADARGVTWVKPSLVAEIGFTQTTTDGLLRHPTFHGLRDDKPASEVKMEVATGVDQEKTQAYPLTHPDKVVYPDVGVTKRELLDYYALVAERMLPHVANRPLTLVRCPNGCGKPCFFQKHPGAATLPGLRSISIREKEGKSPYSVLDDALGLFGLVQLGALEVHTWGSHADDFEHPDVLVFDLDPDPSVEYHAVIDAAHAVRKVFEQAKLESFVKTTGGKGLHVCIPIAPDLGWVQIKDFTDRVATALAEQAPTLYVATQSKAKRKGKIFIDYLRNARGATFIAPYSTRARDGAPIATPLDWDELSPQLPPHHFNVRNIQKRLSRLPSDPFERMARLTQHLRPERNPQA